MNMTSSAMEYQNAISEYDMELIRGWNSAQLQEWKTCIHEVIHDQALAQRDAEAICMEAGSLSYRELDELSTSLARHLLFLGIEREAIVPLCFDKSMENVISMLGVMKAGLAFCPLDPTAPISRLRTLISNVGAKFLLCSQQHASLLSTVADNVIPIDRDILNQLPQSSENELPQVASNDLAYLIYTSGSVSSHFIFF